MAQRVAASTFEDEGIANDAMYDDDEYPGMTTSTADAAAEHSADGGGGDDAVQQPEGGSSYADDYDIDDDDDFFQGPSGVRRTGPSSSSSAPSSPPSSPSWAMQEEAVSITPDQRRAAVMNDREGGGNDFSGFGGNAGAAAPGNDFSGSAGGATAVAAAPGGGGDRWNSAATEMRDRMEAGSGAAVGWANDDIISDGGQAWFESDEDWYEPEYKEVTAPEGSILEKVQRIHLRQPKDFSFEDGEYFELTGYVKANTDNQFCCVLEVAERARERRIEQLEALNPVPPGQSLPPIQQAIVDLALEIEASGGKTSAYLAMKEAADRARLRWELQEAAWAWDNYCEEYMPELGVSERASRLLHMGMRVEDAMDFEKDLVVHEEDYNKRF